MNTPLRPALATSLFAITFALLGAEASRVRTLFDFAKDYAPATVRATGANATQVRDLVRVTTGHTEPWPGVTLLAPGGSWDLAEFAAVTLRVRNPGSQRLTVNLRVDNPGADGVKHCRTGSVTLEPGATGTARVELKRTSEDKLDGRLFGLRGYPVKAGGDGTLDPARLNQVLVFLNHPKEDHTFELLELAAVGTYTRPTAWTTDATPYLPLIDSLGQYRHKDWPGKAGGVAALAEARDRERAGLTNAAGSMAPMAGWNAYGGWAAGPQLPATGFFRTEKHAGKWWLVDPEGRLFWSHGIDCVRMMDATAIEERESWFENPPWLEPELAEFVVPSAYALKGHYAGRSPKCFSFAAANLRRKYGPEWKQVYPEVIHLRLRSWGLNTIANWSDLGVALLRRTPYTDTVGSRGGRMLEGSEGYWGKFPDVFDPAFAAGLRRQMEGKRGRSANDPWCLGYFSDNEMSWGDELSLALAALASPPDQPAKLAFLADLQAKYGEIAKLNTAWGTSHASWDALRSATARPEAAKAGDDLKAFYTRTAEQYFRTVREAIKAAAPNQLYLGCRFAWVNARAARAAAKYCDVVSYNIYEHGVADFRFNGEADVPLIIGEFHFGALDRGMFHTGLVPVANQAERAAAYRAYVEGALRHPQFVGTHWFQYQDEPTTGRVYDEENYQIGFVDIADTPYAETVAASRAVGEGLYRTRLGP